MIARSSSSASLSSSYFLDGPIDRSAMSEDDEHHRTRSAMSDDNHPPRRSQKRKVITSAFRSSVEKKMKEKEKKKEKRMEMEKEKEKEKEDSERDDDCCPDAPAPNLKYGHWDDAKDIPDEIIKSWITNDPSEFPTEEEIKGGIFNRARQYLKEVVENEGFHLETYPVGFSGIASLMPARLYYEGYEEKLHQLTNFLARFSLEKNNLSTLFEVTELGEVNIEPSRCETWYINFHAKHVRTGAIGTFRARVSETMDDDKYAVAYFKQMS